MTSNSEINSYALKRYQKEFGDKGTFRLLTSEELRKDRLMLPQQGIFSYTDDFLNLNEVARDYPTIHEMPIQDVESLSQTIEEMARAAYRAPIFIKDAGGVLHPIPYDLEEMGITPEYKLVYMGKELETPPKNML